MLSYDDVAELLRLQAKAYELLLWLSHESADDPDLLSADAAAGLARAGSAAAWVERHRHRLPQDLAALDPHGPFANLLASFFATSFRVERVEFGNRVVWSRIVLGASAGPPERTGLAHSQALAVKHLAASQGLPMTEAQAGDLVRTRRDLRDAFLLWTYVWELDRRARNKGKGPVVHRIWRSLPTQTKRALTADLVWSARQQVLDAAGA
ncbi:hypothetical protein OHA72_32295 [Dactylosporangium sp. NBC_01737]|uniref:hypothetical protein n=1 Tax=Dactylosporangium sp. NBC_01737 TaxID=2975959 RepID=UPI002E10155E|nr:hypothetical protein OHA72_32295 [Dactylosporangium sp. NBC_01737]